MVKKEMDDEDEEMVKEDSKKKEKHKPKKLTFSIPLPTSKKLLLPLIVIVAIVIILLLKWPFTAGSSFGDNVKLTYSLALEDGTVLDEGEQSFVLGSIASGFGLASDKIDQEIKAMKVGGEKTITLEPAEAFGEYDYTNIEEINRTVEMNKTFEISAEQIASFTEWFNGTFGKEPAVGDTGAYLTADWNSTIISISDKGIVLRHEAKDGTLPLLPSGNKTVIVTDDKILITFNPGEDFPNVIDVTEDKITIDYNSEYAGQKLIVNVKVEEITKKATTSGSTGKPKVELFVMGFCPYGVQAENNILPVVEALGDNIDFKIRFIVNVNGEKIENVNSLHGINEAKEDARQAIIMRDYPDQFYAYLTEINNNCYSLSRDATKLDECWKNAATGLGMDINKIETAAYGKEGTDLLKADEAITQQLAISSSPTLMINDVKSDAIYSGTEATQQAICAVFSTAPSACGTQISAPAAGSQPSGSC